MAKKRNSGSMSPSGFTEVSKRWGDRDTTIVYGPNQRPSRDRLSDFIVREGGSRGGRGTGGGHIPS